MRPVDDVLRIELVAGPGEVSLEVGPRILRHVAKEVNQRAVWLGKLGMARRLAVGIVLVTLGGAPAFGQTSVSVAVRHATRAVGTHDVLPATAQGLVIGTSTRVIGRLGAWGSFTTWPEPIGRTVALGGRFDLARDDWKLRPAVLLGTWRKPTRGAPWELIFGGGVGFRLRGRWSGSVALGVITIRSTGLLYAVPQAGVAYTLWP